MSLKVRTFKVIKLNKNLGIIIILAILSTAFASIKVIYGQSGNLTMNQTNGISQNHSEVYGDALIDVLKNVNITIPSDLHPTTQQLEKIVDEIVNGGHPSKILDELRQNKNKP